MRAMAFDVGDRVLAPQSQRRLSPGATATKQPRHGVIEEVLRGDPNPRYLIRWDEGPPSIYAPRDSGLRLESASSAT
jgi:Domain of unknown function (DUF1918)